MSDLPVQEDGDTVSDHTLRFWHAAGTGPLPHCCCMLGPAPLWTAALPSKWLPGRSSVLQEGGMLGSRRIVDRESEYSKRRLNRIISPDRNDAFQVCAASWPACAPRSTLPLPARMQVPAPASTPLVSLVWCRARNAHRRSRCARGPCSQPSPAPPFCRRRVATPLQLLFSSVHRC